MDRTGLSYMSSTLYRLLPDVGCYLQPIFLRLTQLCGTIDPCRIMYRKDKILGFRKRFFAALFLAIRNMETEHFLNYCIKMTRLELVLK